MTIPSWEVKVGFGNWILGFEIYSIIENLVLRARSETMGSALKTIQSVE
jgi:hypothetical protein